MSFLEGTFNTFEFSIIRVHDIDTVLHGKEPGRRQPNFTVRFLFLSTSR